MIAPVLVLPLPLLLLVLRSSFTKWKEWRDINLKINKLNVILHRFCTPGSDSYLAKIIGSNTSTNGENCKATPPGVFSTLHTPTSRAEKFSMRAVISAVVARSRGVLPDLHLRLINSETFGDRLDRTTCSKMISTISALLASTASWSGVRPPSLSAAKRSTVTDVFEGLCKGNTNNKTCSWCYWKYCRSPTSNAINVQILTALHEQFWEWTFKDIDICDAYLSVQEKIINLSGTELDVKAMKPFPQMKIWWDCRINFHSEEQSHVTFWYTMSERWLTFHAGKRFWPINPKYLV